jgi:exonuclease VII small subunit
MANALSGDYQVISKKEFAEALKEFKKLVRKLEP